MCGLAGFIDPKRETSREQLSSIAERMARACFHRGPDDSGLWVDEISGIALGHRRLSILDLSTGGHQPMKSPDDRYVIVYNGEIYNFVELRQTLRNLGHRFSSTSDTEVILHCFVRWGVPNALEKFVGMFAFALWDRKERSLYLARDRFGEKPLYYGIQNGVFFFASELKSFRAHPDFEGTIDRSVVGLLLRYGYVPAPYSIYCGVRKLLPGTFLCLRLDRESCFAVPEPTPYWSLKSVVKAGEQGRFDGSVEEGIAELDRLVKQAVTLQMVADVPVGAFLSGGIDSSTVVAIMQAQSSRPIRTFTVGFQEKPYNEADHAKSVAAWLRTDHTEIILTACETLSVIPNLPQIYDEPFADSSQIPTYLVAALAGRHVKVCLSGDAGDELFGGYNRYVWASLISTALRLSPLSRKQVAALIRNIPLMYWDSILSFFTPILPLSFRPTKLGDKMHKLAEMIGTDSPDWLYSGLMHHWRRPLEIVQDINELPLTLDHVKGFPLDRDLRDAMMYRDTLTYLPDDILVKVDRASMAVSLESRIPFLDHRIAEFAWTLPQSLKIHRLRGKRVLRELLNRYVPPRLTNRAKMGFGLPVGDWLQGPLREWAESLIDASLLRRQGFFRVEPIRKKWNEHIEGKRQWTADLWIILMFQGWLDSVQS
jgi:asparagine synthase (glutamine-hydrolysing)